MSQKDIRNEAYKLSSQLVDLVDSITPFTEALESVSDFNRAFGISIANKKNIGTEKEYQLKYELMKEELEEYLASCKNEDYVEMCDGVVDMMYILLGIILHHGMQDFFFEMFDEVHRSNMSKLENGKVLRRHDGKVLKGSEYFKPNLEVIINGKP